jgi:hypothetical protein
MEEALDPEQLCRPLDLGSSLAWLHSLCLEWEGDVVGHRHVGIEGVGLEDHGDAPRPRGQTDHVLTTEKDLSTGGLLETGDHPQQGGLATTGWTQEDQELTFLGPDVDTIDGHHVAEVLAQTADFYNSHPTDPGGPNPPRRRFAPAVPPSGRGDKGVRAMGVNPVAIASITRYRRVRVPASRRRWR